MSMTETGLKVAPRAARQTRFVLPISDDVRLVSVETARAALGVTAEEIFEQVEDQLLVAFDLAMPGSVRREMRIWSGSLRRSQITDQDAIIANCLLTNADGVQNPNFNVNNSQLECAWCISNEQLLRFIKAAPPLITGVRVGRNWKVNRFSAFQFLKARML